MFVKEKKKCKMKILKLMIDKSFLEICVRLQLVKYLGKKYEIYNIKC